MKVTFAKSEQAAEYARTFYFSAPADMASVRQIAGQFIELRVTHDNRDSRGDKRWFTLSNSPTEDMLAITTKFATENGSSFKAALQALEPGSLVDMSAPMGDFVLPKDASIPLVFVAGGIGATPFHSMVKFVLDSNEARDITVLYAANSIAEIAFQDTLKCLGDKFVTVVGEHLTTEKILAVADQQKGYLYISGPEPMVEAIQQGLKDAGFDKKRIQTDYFPGYTTI